MRYRTPFSRISLTYNANFDFNYFYFGAVDLLPSVYVDRVSIDVLLKFAES